MASYVSEITGSGRNHIKLSSRIGSAVALTAAALAGFAALAGAAGAATTPGGHSGGASHAVFVQTDNTAGNQVVAYDRAADGTLTLAGTYRHRRTRRPAHRLGGRPPRLPGLADLRSGARAAVRGERGQQHGLGLRRQRGQAAPAADHQLRRNIPGQRGRARQPRLRAERAERRIGAGLPGDRPRPEPHRRIGAAAAPRSRRPPRSSPTRRARSRSRRTARSSS